MTSCLGSIQFYSKFLPPNLSTIIGPLNNLTCQDTNWCRSEKQKVAFQITKDLIKNDTILVNYDSSIPIGISCDALDVSLGIVLFDRYPDGSEKLIANTSKTLTDTQRKYSQIQKEALSIIFSLHKFHQYLYGRKFILVTDHRYLYSILLN